MTSKEEWSRACVNTINAATALETGAPLPLLNVTAIASHLVGCDECQRLLVQKIIQWEQNLPLPDPPQVIARWRPLVLHVWIPRTEQNVSWEADRQQLEMLAGAAWAIDGGHVQRWLGALNGLAQDVGGLGGGQRGDVAN